MVVLANAKPASFILSAKRKSIEYLLGLIGLSNIREKPAGGAKSPAQSLKKSFGKFWCGWVFVSTVFVSTVFVSTVFVSTAKS